MKNRDKPDYKLWAKKETWSLKEGVLLLHGLDPLKHRSLRPYDREIPPEFEEVQKTYLLMRSVPWRERYPEFYSYSDGLHPIVIIREAGRKEIRVPKLLLKAVNERFKREETEVKELPSIPKESESVHREPIYPYKEIQENKTTSEPTLTSRERRNLLKTIGILVQMHFAEGQNSSPRYNRGNKLNAYQVAQSILEKAQAMGMETEGMKSLDRKITDALELLEEEIA